MIKLIKKSIRKLSKPRNLLFLTALFLLLALGLHAVIHHEHPKEIFGADGTQAYLHGGDKKYWWMVILAAYLFIAGVASLLVKNQLLAPRVILPSSAFGPLYLRVDLSKLFDPIRIALREGRLQRKICDCVFYHFLMSAKTSVGFNLLLMIKHYEKTNLNIAIGDGGITPRSIAAHSFRS